MTPTDPRPRAPLTLREKVLAGVALPLVLALGYGYLRVRPVRAETAALESETDALRAALAARSPASLLPAGVLAARREETLAAIDAARARVAALEARFAPAAAAQDLALEISALAVRSGARVRENTPQEAKVAAAGRASREHARPLRRIVLETSFQGLRALLEGLGRLPYRATVVSIELERRDEPAPHLVATLGVAL